MKALSLETTKLLDKMYNLRGKDSVILVKMDEQKQAAEKTLERTTVEKSELQEKISNLELEREQLDSQGERLLDVLNGIDRADYEIVLNSLNIDFDPEAISQKISYNLPGTIEKVSNEVSNAEKNLKEVEEEMESAITTIDELAIRKDAALANQDKLNEYFELALTGKINITRDSITSLLEQFDFSEEEQREAAKILMFPEDSLYIYDNKKLDSADEIGKSISEVISEAKDAIEEESEEREDFEIVSLEIAKLEAEKPVDIVTLESAKAEVSFENSVPVEVIGLNDVVSGKVKAVEVMGLKEAVEDQGIIEKDEINESVFDGELNLDDFTAPIFGEEEIPSFNPFASDDSDKVTISNEMFVSADEEEIEEYLNKIGINYLDFTSQDLDELKDNFNKDLFKKNVDLMNNNSIDLDIFTDHASLLYDAELEEKVNVLLNIGKEPIDIYLNPSILVKYTTEKLNNAIALLTSNGMDPKNVPLMAY